MGERHLQLALELWDGATVAVRYRSFLLNDAIPPGGLPFRPYMHEKGNGRVPIERFFEAPRQVGEAVGLVFDFDAIERAPNSRLSHRLIYTTPEAQRREMIDALYGAYFQYGQDIGDVDVLVAIAAGLGLDPIATRAALLGDAGDGQIEADLDWARTLGINAVPFMVLDGRYGLSGAQPPEVIRKALQRAAG